MTNSERTVPLAELKDLSTGTLVNLIGDTVRVDATDETGTTTVVSQLALIGFDSDYGLTLIFQGTPEPLNFTAEEMADEAGVGTLTYTDWNL